MAGVDSIRKVQEAEARSKSMIEKANKDKAEAIEKAKQSASKMMAEAEAKMEELRSSTTEMSAKEFEKEKVRILASAKKNADKLRKTKASKAMLEKVAKESVKKMVGE